MEALNIMEEKLKEMAYKDLKERLIYLLCKPYPYYQALYNVVYLDETWHTLEGCEILNIWHLLFCKAWCDWWK